MCGINGMVAFKGTVDKKKIAIMNGVLEHRGPDDEGIYISPDKKVGFGHRRLAIIDLSPTGKQPMSNADGTVWITFNGEIYNYQDIVSVLKKKGYAFRGTSDTEAIIYAYEEYGEACLDLFRGMFAFAIWDKKKQRLFIARDRVGEKPVYYATFDNTFYFASELRAILEASRCKRAINAEALHMYFLYNLHHVPEPYCIIKGINKLPPAHYMIVDKTGVRIKKYWSVDYKKENKTEEEFIDEYRRLVAECVNLREVSDVPISALLSGGIDSSTIVALMKNKKLSTFSIGFHKNDPELQRARKVSQLFKTKNREILFREEFIKKLPELIFTYGEPYNLMPALYSYVLSEEIGKNFKVALAGNGADEIFYGYDGSNALLLLTKLEKIIPRSLAGMIAAIIPDRFENIKLAMIALSSSPDTQKGNMYRHIGRKLKNKLYDHTVKQQLENFDEGKILDSVMKECNSPYLIERFYHVGLMLENAHSVTIAADTTGMAHSIEIRAPFLDHKLIEFAAKLPLSLKVPSMIDKSKNKYIMKKAMEGTLPEDILYAKKMGFGYNIEWDKLLRTKWKGLVERVLMVELPKTGLFNAAYLKSLIGSDNSQLVWGLVNFYIWYELFINQKNFKELRME